MYTERGSFPPNLAGKLHRYYSKEAWCGPSGPPESVRRVNAWAKNSCEVHAHREGLGVSKTTDAKERCHPKCSHLMLLVLLKNLELLHKPPLSRRRPALEFQPKSLLGYTPGPGSALCVFFLCGFPPGAQTSSNSLRRAREGNGEL